MMKTAVVAPPRSMVFTVEHGEFSEKSGNVDKKEVITRKKMMLDAFLSDFGEGKMSEVDEMSELGHTPIFYTECQVNIESDKPIESKKPMESKKPKKYAEK